VDGHINLIVVVGAILRRRDGKLDAADSWIPDDRRDDRKVGVVVVPVRAPTYKDEVML
jgi:hypothetical protein